VQAQLVKKLVNTDAVHISN